MWSVAFFLKSVIFCIRFFCIDTFNWVHSYPHIVLGAFFVTVSSSLWLSHLSSFACLYNCFRSVCFLPLLYGVLTSCMRQGPAGDFLSRPELDPSLAPPLPLFYSPCVLLSSLSLHLFILSFVSRFPPLVLFFSFPTVPLPRVSFSKRLTLFTWNMSSLWKINTTKILVDHFMCNKYHAINQISMSPRRIDLSSISLYAGLSFSVFL